MSRGGGAGVGQEGTPKKALRAFKLMLALYPRDFREAFGPEMCEVFLARYREKTGSHSGQMRQLFASGIFLFSTGADSIREAAAERWRSSLTPPDGGPTNGQPSRPSRGRPLEWLRQDLAHALRLIRKQPGFSLVVCATLALGIGANTALFSVLHGVLISPLPYPESDQLVFLFEREVELGWERNGFPPANIRAYQIQNRTFQTIGAFFSVPAAMSGDGEPERVTTTGVTSEFFTVLRTTPSLGRLLIPEDEVPGQDGVVVLSHGFWQRRFGSDPSLVGRTIQLDGDEKQVVGILPEGFRPPTGESEIWWPLALGESGWQERRNHFLSGIGRLMPGIDPERGEADLTTIARQREQDFPDTNAGSLVNVESLLDFTVGDIRRPLWIMMGAALLVLLIACANVANLFLSRSLARERELAVRGALGAGRRRILHLMATESLVLALMGGGLGVLFAYFCLEAVLALEPGSLPRIEAIGINAGVLAFSLIVTVITSTLFGALPAVLASRSDLASGLKEASSRSTQSPSPRRLKSMLALSQMAIAIVLLTGAGLLTRSFIRLQQVDPGFESENVLQAKITLAGSPYRDPEAVHRFQGDLTVGLQRAPGVLLSAQVSNPPMSMTPQVWLHIEGHEAEGEQPPVVSRIFASDQYFELMGMSLLEGRPFDERDREGSPYVVVISQAMAERHWSDESPIGRMIRIGGRESEPMEVVGVVSDLRQYGMRYRPYPAAYIPLSQVPVNDFTVMLRVAEDPIAAVSHLRSLIRELDPNLPVYGIRTLNSVLGADVAQPRFAMFLAAVFAGVALSLATVGIFGVLSYTVAQRTHEIGIRLALGAKAGRVLSLVLKQGIALVALALAVGLPLAWALTRAMDSLLFEVGPADPVTFFGVAAGVVFSTLLACYIPSARAAKVSPAQAMRDE